MYTWKHCGVRSGDYAQAWDISIILAGAVSDIMEEGQNILYLLQNTPLLYRNVANLLLAESSKLYP